MAIKGKLQVLTANGYQFVFCRNRDINSYKTVTTTQDYKKALNQDALEYFEKHCGNEIFRVLPWEIIGKYQLESE